MLPFKVQRHILRKHDRLSNKIYLPSLQEYNSPGGGIIGHVDGNELRELLESIGITQADFSKLVGVTTRCVHFWVSRQHKIPGPVVAYVRLYCLLPPELKQFELGRLKFKCA